MNVSKVENIALAILLIAFAVGFGDAHESMFWFLGRSVGAIFFGVYVIFMVLEKKSALPDEQQRAVSGKSKNSSEPHPRVTKFRQGKLRSGPHHGCLTSARWNISDRKWVFAH